MLSRVKNRFSDTSNAIRSDTEWYDYLNASYRAFVRRAKWPSLIASVAVAIPAGKRSVVLPTVAIQGGVQAVFDATDIPLDRQPGDLPWKRVRYMADVPSKPVWWEQRGDRITVLPAPAAATSVTVLYLTAPAPIVAATTPVIPETYHDAIVAGAVARAYRDDDQPEIASQYDGEFDMYVAMAVEDLAGEPQTSAPPA